MQDHGDHDHSGHGHSPGGHIHADPRSAKSLAWVAAFTGVFMIAELVGGLVAGSLALLSDAGHMFVDMSGLILAAIVARISARPANDRQTFGYRRAEVLGAFVNGAILCGLVLFIVWESIHRLFSEPDIKGWLMIWVAAGGLAFNLVIAALLARGGAHKRDINLRGALLNVISDAVGSVGALAAGLLIMFFGWTAADAIAGLIVAALIAFNAVRLLRQTINILLESAPAGIELEAVRSAVAEVKGVKTVHDLHIWSVVPGFETLTLHVELENEAALLRWDETLLEINRVLKDRFKLHHNIIQPELNAGLHKEIEHR